jgi:Serine dehydrogenase proteinase
MGAEQRRTLIQQIQERRGNSRLLCCLTSDRNNAQGIISKDFLFRFFLHLKSTPDMESLDILLFTLGGDTLAAYALGRFIRQFTKKVGVLVPYMCHSGGTLFALGADEIAMTRVATLSAIDPSIAGAFNPIVEPAPGQKLPIPVAVESVEGFRNTVKEWELDGEGRARALQLLSEKVHPLLIGDLHRSKEQIVRLATNLMKQHQEDNEKIRNIVETLATRLGSHDYLLGPAEARDLLGPQVLAPNADLEELIWRLYQDFAEEMELGVPFEPGLEIQASLQQRQGQQGPIALAPIQKILKIVMIESIVNNELRSDVWERKMLMMPTGQMQILSNFWR